MSDKVYISYEWVHKLCQESAKEILPKFHPNVIVAIGGGGFIPARILRTFLKAQGSPNIPIQAIGLSLYESFGTADYEEKIGKEVVRTQWLDFSSLQEHKVELIGKHILIVDEVDDTRTTLHYAVTELQKDLDELATKLGRTDKTIISVFVLHNKTKPKKADLPQEMFDQGLYFAAETVGDEWICYPWEAHDIDTHTEIARQQGRI